MISIFESHEILLLFPEIQVSIYTADKTKRKQETKGEKQEIDVFPFLPNLLHAFQKRRQSSMDQ